MVDLEQGVRGDAIETAVGEEDLGAAVTCRANEITIEHRHPLMSGLPLRLPGTLQLNAALDAEELPRTHQLMAASAGKRRETAAGAICQAFRVFPALLGIGRTGVVELLGGLQQLAAPPRWEGLCRRLLVSGIGSLDRLASPRFRGEIETAVGEKDKGCCDEPNDGD